MVWGAGPPCRPGRPANFFFGGASGAIRIRAGGAGRGPSKKKIGRPARPAWRAGPPYHILYHILYILYFVSYKILLDGLFFPLDCVNKKKSGRPAGQARPAWRAGPPYHILYHILYILYNIIYKILLDGLVFLLDGLFFPLGGLFPY